MCLARAKSLFIASVQIMKIRHLLSYLRVIYLPFFAFTLLKMAKLNLDKYRLAEIAQLSTRVVILSHYFWEDI